MSARSIQRHPDDGGDDTFGAATNTTSDPHARVQVQVPRITRLHVNVESEGVCLGVDLIRLSRIIQLFQSVPGPDAPSFIPDRYVCGRVIVCL